MSNSGSSSPENSSSLETRTSTSHSSGRKYITLGPYRLVHLGQGRHDKYSSPSDTDSSDDAMSNPSAISLNQDEFTHSPSSSRDYPTDVKSLNSSDSSLHQEYSNPSNLSANESNVSANESNVSANESNVSANESNVSVNESNVSANESNVSANVFTEKERPINVQMPGRISVLVITTQELPETLNNRSNVSNNRKCNLQSDVPEIKATATTRDNSVIRGSQNILCQTSDECIPPYESEPNRLSRTSAVVIKIKGIGVLPETSNINEAVSNERETYRLDTKSENTIKTKLLDEIPKTSNNPDAVTNNSSCNPQNDVMRRQKPTTSCDNSVMRCSQSILSQTPNRCITPNENQPNSLLARMLSMPVYSKPATANPWKEQNKNSVNRSNLVVRTGNGNDDSNFEKFNPLNFQQTQETSTLRGNTVIGGSQNILSQIPTEYKPPYENEPNSLLDSDPRHKKNMPVYSKPVTANPWKEQIKSSVYRSNPVVRTGNENDDSNFEKLNPQNVQQTQETSTLRGNTVIGDSQNILSQTPTEYKPPYENEPNSLLDSDPRHKKNMPEYSKPVTGNPWRAPNTSSVYRNNPVVRTGDENDVSNARRCNPQNDVQQAQETSTIDGNSVMGLSQDILDLTLKEYIPPNERASK